MKIVTLICFCFLLYLAAGVVWLWPTPKPHITREQQNYSVKEFCSDHPDVCSKSRLAKYSTPSPIPQQGMVVVQP